MDIIHEKHIIGHIKIDNIGFIRQLSKSYVNDTYDEILLSYLSNIDCKFNVVHISCYKSKNLKYELKFGDMYLILYSNKNELYNIKSAMHHINIYRNELDLKNLEIKELNLHTYKRSNVYLPLILESLSFDKPHFMANLKDLNFLKKIKMYGIKRSKTNQLYDFSVITNLKEISIYETKISLKLPSSIDCLEICNSLVNITNPIKIKDFINVQGIFYCDKFQYTFGYFNHCELRSLGKIVKKIGKNDLVHKGIIYPPIGNFFEVKFALLYLSSDIRDDKKFGEYLYTNLNNLSFKDLNFIYFFHTVGDKTSQKFKENLIGKNISNNKEIEKILGVEYE